MPQAMGVLHKILQRLEEYQAIRTNDPQRAYNDLSLAQELWPGEAAGGADGREAASGKNVTAEDDVTLDQVQE